MTGPVVGWWGKRLPVYSHMYNCTWLNERAAELAVYRSWSGPGSVLEIGNVLSHYENLAHGGRVVDRYEQAPGVENVDVFDVAGTFDRIVAISTLEHVRWDEDPRVDGGSADAIAHLRTLLAPRGRMLVTIPTGHNPPLDEILATGAGTDRCCTLVRDMDSWRQTDTLEFRPYGKTQPWAEAVWIGEWSAR